ncbi:alpha-kinase family-domain-containing protein [Mycena olivaceomarginata]|nr:alpha-kinase family-domain-containing protein [Mycena olivaceomarginata]
MHKPPPFAIPQLVFVDAALAMIPGPDKDLYLLEQCIAENSEGKFRKYINNRAAIPTLFENKDDKECAEFLAFSQHYQYLKTHKMLFVSDYQGRNSLLTDPQIMKLEGARHLFADGNVSTGFASFETDHTCNMFCCFFELSTDYANWGSSSNADAELDQSDAFAPPEQSVDGIQTMEISALTNRS